VVCGSWNISFCQHEKEREKISVWSRKYMAEIFKGIVWPDWIGLKGIPVTCILEKIDQ
jgi:hypothetical protein